MNRTVDLGCRVLWQDCQRLRSKISARSVHPTYHKLSELKRDSESIRSIFSFLLKINGAELPSGIREEVERLELIVEAQYAKDKLKRESRKVAER